MNIGIDIDDTIANTYDVLFNYAQKYTCEELNREIPEKHEEIPMRKYTETFHNWNKEETKDFFNKYYEKTIVDVRPKMFASEIIGRLKKEGNKIYIITARFPMEKFNVEKITKDWLIKNKIEFDELIINAGEKANIAKEKNINVFIDDSYIQCKNVAEKNIKTFLMDSKTNVRFEDDKYIRVYSWPHIYQKFKSL